MMGRAGCLLLILIAVIVGYQQYSINKMRSEVGSISDKLHLGEAARSEGKTEGKDLVTSLAEAEKHTRRAQELIKKRKLDEAQAELSRVLADLKSANTVSTDITGDVADFLGDARDNAVEVFQKAWKDISEEAKPKGEKKQ